jgi:hypothetical protein
MKVEIRYVVFAVCTVVLLGTVRGLAQPPTLVQLEARVAKLEARVPRVVKPEGLVWAAAGSLDSEKDLEFLPGAADTVQLLEVKFPVGRFSDPPVVTANARWKNANTATWLPGAKDSFAVTIFDLNARGFKALLRRVDPSNKSITAGVMLDWIAVSAPPKG